MYTDALFQNGEVTVTIPGQVGMQVGIAEHMSIEDPKTKEVFPVW